MRYFRDFRLARTHLCSFGPEVAAGAMLGEGIVGAELASGGALALDAGAFGAGSGFGAALTGALPYISAGSSALSAGGQLLAGHSAGKFAEYNARLAEQEAENTRIATEYEVQRQKRRTRLAGGAARATIAGSGISEEGSSLLSEAAIDELAALDEAAIRHSGSVAEAHARSQAAAERMQGEGAKRGSYFGAATSLLTGAVNYGRLKTGKSLV